MLKADSQDPPTFRRPIDRGDGSIRRIILSARIWSRSRQLKAAERQRPRAGGRMACWLRSRYRTETYFHDRLAALASTSAVNRATERGCV